MTDPHPKEPFRSRCCTCCTYVLLTIFSLMAALALGAFVAHEGSPRAVAATVNFRLMRFFRDLSRVKARRRRFGQEGALMPVLMGIEEPLPLGDASVGLSLTLEELSEFDGRPLEGSSETANLYLAIHGRIYDVTAGGSFYGPGRSYHKLVGKDATRAFCTGCLEAACLISNVDGLSESQLHEAHRWIELYEHHDKYKLVGSVRETSDAELLAGLPDGEDAGNFLARVEEARREDERERLEAARAAENSKKWHPFKLR